MKLPTLDIVIVNWNSGSALVRCLTSISAPHNAGFHLSRVCIVDNASTDNSLNGIEALAPRPVVYRNTSNLGFAAACNQGAHGSSADYLLFLNPDTRLTPDSLSVPTLFMEEKQNRRIGICGIPLLDDWGQPATCSAAFPSSLLLCAETCGLDRLIGRRFAAYGQTAGPTQRRRMVDQVIGAYFLVRASLFKELGGFDERFFLYYEEVDFSLRARAYHYTSCVVFGAVAYHTGCVSSNRVKDLSLFYLLRSKLQFAHKHFSIWGQVSVGICTLFLEPWARCLHGVCTKSTGTITNTIRAYAYLFQDFCADISHKAQGSLAPYCRAVVRPAFSKRTNTANGR
jgi:GT2 family glycosyltransferase